MAATQHEGEYVPGVFLAIDETGTQNGGIAVNFPTPIRIPARTDVQVAAQSDNPSANVTALAAIM